MKFDVIVPAFGTPQPKDPLYPLCQGGYRAMLEIAGKPMIQWVLDALNASAGVDRILVAGLPAMTSLSSEKPLILLEVEGSPLAHIQAGIQTLQPDPTENKPVLLVSADIPALTAEMVDWMAAAVAESDHEMYYTIIARAEMEKQFPESRRSYITLKNGPVCSSGLNAIRPSVVTGKIPNWGRVLSAHENPLRLVSLVGYDTLFMLMLRRLSLGELQATLSRRLGIRARIMLCPFPESGMDVDKPHQRELVAAELRRREGIRERAKNH